MKSVSHQKEEIGALLRDYRSMTPALRRRLFRLGFDVIESRRHVRLVFRDDPSIVQILPATGSDWRGGRNAAATLRRKLTKCAPMNDTR